MMGGDPGIIRGKPNISGKKGDNQLGEIQLRKHQWAEESLAHNAKLDRSNNAEDFCNIAVAAEEKI